MIRDLLSNDNNLYCRPLILISVCFSTPPSRLLCRPPPHALLTSCLSFIHSISTRVLSDAPAAPIPSGTVWFRCPRLPGRCLRPLSWCSGQLWPRVCSAPTLSDLRQVLAPLSFNFIYNVEKRRICFTNDPRQFHVVAQRAVLRRSLRSSLKSGGGGALTSNVCRETRREGVQVDTGSLLSLDWMVLQHLRLSASPRLPYFTSSVRETSRPPSV